MNHRGITRIASGVLASALLFLTACSQPPNPADPDPSPAESPPPAPPAPTAGPESRDPLTGTNTSRPDSSEDQQAAGPQ